jgi:hypothetical protein
MTAAIDTYRPDLTVGVASEASPLARRVEGTLLAALGLQVAFMLPSLASWFMDERLLEGVSVWSKPLKFQVSILILVGTLLLLLPLVRADVLAGRLARASAMVVAVSATFEIAYIVIQAARGRASHFNTSTPIETTLYQLMGIGAVSMVVAAFIFGWLILRHGRPGTGQGLRLGAAWGLMLGAVLTLITAGVLSSGFDGPGHWVGGVKTDADGLILLGWSRSGGDLRVPHFFATHIMQALPLLGLTLDRLRPDLARIGIGAGAIASLLVVAATFAQALSGKPFI